MSERDKARDYVTYLLERGDTEDYLHFRKANNWSAGILSGLFIAGVAVASPVAAFGAAIMGGMSYLSRNKNKLFDEDRGYGSAHPSSLRIEYAWWQINEPQRMPKIDGLSGVVNGVSNSVPAFLFRMAALVCCEMTRAGVSAVREFHLGFVNDQSGETIVGGLLKGAERKLARVSSVLIPTDFRPGNPVDWLAAQSFARGKGLG